MDKTIHATSVNDTVYGCAGNQPAQPLTVWSQDETATSPLRLGHFQDNAQTFVYDAAWCRSAQASRHNPIGSLPHTPSAAALVADTLPDSWGRGLIERYLRAKAARDETVYVEPSERDILTHIADEVRMGAYRFSEGVNAFGTPSFVGQTPGCLPALIDLPELQALVARYERHERLSAHTLETLVQAGAALGGSRPKVNVLRGDDTLWIAKFASIHDDRNYAAWEFVSMTLARRAGIRTPDFGLIGNNILLTKRFDRTDDGRRRHYYSMRALLGAQRNHEPRSYLDILGLIERICGNDSRDIEELFRRVAFKMMVSDGDDHLRNHGFLLTREGWHLAPAFDMTPSLSAEHLCLTWDEECADFDLAGLIAAAPVWGIGVERAREIVADCAQALAGWQAVARSVGIAPDEIERMKGAFRPSDGLVEGIGENLLRTLITGRGSEQMQACIPA